ncbi:type II toxin-antitoxin system prevent-host-death family antitoxin [Mycolicibacterium frederiksbergense]|uniref:Antitoxin n=1 Tax=Mycolicibacterium frederiksbergense TaxID=117567 RepID=A0A6H0S0M6_9MYCO|nr:type II toxin-antitoxin system prevent-host-death family antitoxin [Mycolicibacterium frederiksbergense]QIV79875.1 type II toxin-antitoxin system Phd/YefM family antitoxin [Mycolicibacterium frederiksbergense]
MTTENVRDLRWTLESVVRSVGRTGEEVVILDKDGQTELAVIISMADYERWKIQTDPPAP